MAEENRFARWTGTLDDISILKVVKAVAISGWVTATGLLSNQEGPSAATKHLHPSLRWLFGVAAVVTNVGQILLIDLRLDDLPCSQTKLGASYLEVMMVIPADVSHLRESVRQEGCRLGLQLVSPSGTAISTLIFIYIRQVNSW